MKLTKDIDLIKQGSYKRKGRTYNVYRMKRKKANKYYKKGLGQYVVFGAKKRKRK